MQVKKMKLADLKPAKYNPASRTLRKKLSPLISNIDEIGLIYPLAVTKEGKIIDGNRRFAAVKEMGWDEVPVLITEGNPEEIFAGVNSTTRRVTGNEKLHIWLSEPRALSPNDQRIHREAEANLGREMLEKIAKAGHSVTMYRWAKEVGNYCEQKKPAFMRKAVRWCMKHRGARVIRAMIALQQPAQILADAIEMDKPISASYSVSK